MRRSFKRKDFFFLLFLLLVVVSAIGYNLIFKFSSTYPSVAQATTSPSGAYVTSFLPDDPVSKRLVISKLGIDTKVEEVGTNERGSMGVPSNYKNVAWYKLGPEPGEKGSAVIAGHLDNSLGLPGVFKDLEKLEIGDRVEIINEAGETLAFEVVEKKIYPYNYPNTQEVFGQQSEAGLNLITCGGEWLKEKKTYNERVVIFTSLI